MIDDVDAFERELIDALPIALEHVPDADAEHYDAVLEGALVSSTHARLFGWLHIPRETVVELKTCQRWINDRGSGLDRRRGRWKIDRDAHRELVARDGVYLLAVLEGGVDDVRAWVMLPAEELDPHLPSWTSNGESETREASKQVRWADVIRPADLAETTPTVEADGGYGGW